MVEIVNEKNFKEIVLQSKKPILLDFYADWCGPCRQMAEVVEELSEDMKSSAVFGKVDVDHNLNLSQRFRIMQVPTFLFIKDGEIVCRETGGISKDELAEELGVWL